MVFLGFMEIILMLVGKYVEFNFVVLFVECLLRNIRSLEIMVVFLVGYFDVLGFEEFVVMVIRLFYKCNVFIFIK